MESNHQEEESIYSNDQEIDQSAQENSFGLGRSYECVFCRRGFNTAQALGGHMNIHRKDRAPRNKPIPNPTSINTRKLHIEEINYTGGSRFYHQIPSTSCSSHLVAPHHAPGIDDVQIDYTAYNFPASTSTTGRPFYANHNSIYFPFGPGIVEEIAKSRRGGIQEEELDLELRL